MTDNDDELPFLPDKVAATRSYAPDSIAPFTPLSIPDELTPPPPGPSTRPVLVGVLLGFILFFSVVIGGMIWANALQ